MAKREPKMPPNVVFIDGGYCYANADGEPVRDEHGLAILVSDVRTVEALTLALRAALKEALDMLDKIPAYIETGSESYEAKPYKYEEQAAELRKLVEG
jgi:hypothetical protein